MSLLLTNIILYHFVEEEFDDDTSSIIEYSKIQKKFIKKRILLFNVFDKKKERNSVVIKKRLKSLNSIFFTKKYSKIVMDTFVLYVISISFLQKNITIHVMDMKGLLKVFCSTASSLKLTVKQRRRIQPNMISNLLKYFLNEVLYFNEETQRVPIVLQLKNVKKSYLSLIVQKLKFKFDIKIINYLKRIPHNGCRPRKMRRV